MKKLLFALLVALLASGCNMRMDPFEGGNGSRANINGEKYLMSDVVLFPKKASFDNTGSGYFSVRILFQHLMGERVCMLDIRLESPTPFVVGEKYTISASSETPCTLWWTSNQEIASRTVDYETVPKEALDGWIVFNKTDGDTVEASFEFDCPSSGTAIRHGFMRLLTSGRTGK